VGQEKETENKTRKKGLIGVLFLSIFEFSLDVNSTPFLAFYFSLFAGIKQK
jgi:hypothetical protein